MNGRQSLNLDSRYMTLVNSRYLSVSATQIYTKGNVKI